MNFQHLKSYSFNKKVLKPQSLRGMSGFTLLEMAMVLAIIGLIMGTILSMTKTLSSSSKIAATQSKEALIKAALINFIATNNRLPCPADPTKLSTQFAGTEAIGAVTAGVCNATPNITYGTVVSGLAPWAALGLTQDSATDGYNQFFTYQVTLTATQTVAATAAGLGKQTISGLQGAISIFSTAYPTPPTASATSPIALNNEINYCGQTSFNPCAAVAIIVSYGADGLGAFSSSGTQSNLPPANTDEAENANLDSFFVMKDASISSANPFDDIILPLSSNDLLSPLTANGTVQTYNAVLNNDFANITAALTAFALNNRASSGPYCPLGGPFTYGTYAYQLPNKLIGTLLPLSGQGPTPILSVTISPGTVAPPNIPISAAYDPWGKPIYYDIATVLPNPPYVNTANTNYQLPIIQCSVASYPSYILRSSGPDAQLGTNDDISLIVPASQFYTTLSSYGF